MAASGASFTAAATAGTSPVARSPSRPHLLPKALESSRTIIETDLCPSELKRGDKSW